ncbi:hypothetical protein F511_25131 [Dorcoceras hygrometricum]|uniref:Uncharacterized protein n=1 Tax=Dorcoceras hygrometricum TaxID=472368 RepID=A0A2Z7BX87_9LAMI|nr:hypothetical protein F511_25131 [Dorcoceras hygrometricum]
MSLFNLQDVCIAIGSLATLYLPMVVDLIGIYGLKGPYCTLTTTNWFLQALSVIPRGSWGDVSRRSYHDPLGKSGIVIPEPQWSLHKLNESQKLANDKSGLGFNSSEFSEGETSTQSQPAYDKFNKMNFVKANVIYDCFESVKYDDQNSPKLSENGKASIDFSKPEGSKPNWIKNKLDKDKAKAGQKPFVPNQPWRSSKKVKTGWKNTQPRIDSYGQNVKSKLNRSHRNYAQTFVDPHTGKAVRVIQVWVPKGTDSDLVIYRTTLLWTFQVPWTTTASKIIDLLSVAHSKSLEDLITQQKEQGLPIEQPCTSTLLDTSVGSGAVLAQFYSMAKSTFWVRPLVLIDGVWTPIQGNHFLRSSCKLSLFVNRKKLPTSMVEEEFVPHCYLIEPVQYWGASPSLIKTWGWARVCTEIIRYNTFVGFFSGSSVETDSEIELSSSDGDTVYRSPSPILQEIDSFEENLQFDLGPVVSNALEEQLYCVETPESPPPIPQRQESSSSSSDSQMNFDTTDFPLDDTTEAQTSLPVATVEAIDNLRAFILQRIDDSNSATLSKLHTLERGLRDALHDQDDNARKLINSVCQDAHTISDVHKIHLNDVKKIVLEVSLLVQIHWKLGRRSTQSML